MWEGRTAQKMQKERSEDYRMVGGIKRMQDVLRDQK